MTNLAASFLSIYCTFVTCNLYYHNFNITKILHMYSIVCGPEFAKNTSNIWNFPRIPGDFYMCPVCVDSTFCFINNNCCPDKELDYPARKCVSHIIHSDKNLSTMYKKYELITTCPTGGNANLTHLCTKSRDVYESIKHPPVMADSNYLSFKNKYCALCNNVEDYIPWRFSMTDCDTTFDLFTNLEDIIAKATRNKCTIYFEHPLKGVYNSNQSCVNKVYIDECNVTGTWITYDANIEYACKSLHNPFVPYKNIFCFMCNPPAKSTETLITSCNLTGLWKVHDYSVSESCIFGEHSEVTFPYKNIYCYMCNTKSGPFLKNRRMYSVFHSNSENILNYYIYDITDVTVLNEDLVFKMQETVKLDVNFSKQYNKWKYKIDCVFPIPISPLDKNITKSLLEQSEKQSCNITDNRNIDFEICLQNISNSTFCLTDFLAVEWGCKIYVLGNGNISSMKTNESSSSMLIKHNGMIVNAESITSKRECYAFNCRDNQYIYPLHYIFCQCCSAILVNSISTPYNSWNIFSKTFYSEKCQQNEVFDSIKNKCRAITCFTGKHLMGIGCQPYLKEYEYLIPFKYILPFRFTLRHIDTNTATELENALENMLLTMFNMTSVVCLNLGNQENKQFHDQMNDGNQENELFYYAQIDVYNSSFSTMEKSLIHFLADIVSSHDINMNLQYDYHSIQQNFSTTNLSECYSEKRQLLSNLLICPHVVFESNEYILRTETYTVDLTEYDTSLRFYEYHIDLDRNLRICLDHFRRILENKDNKHIVHYSIMVACTILSVLCLVITLLTYCLFSSLRTLPGKNIMNLSFCLLLFQILFLLVAVVQSKNELICILIGIFTHYFLLCSFGSFIVCAVHMYKLFGKHKLVSVLESSQSGHLLCVYLTSVYGSSAIIIAGNISVAHVISGNTSFGYGRNGRCFVSDFYSFIATVLTPLVTVFVVNTCLFSVTIYGLKDKKRLTSTLTDSHSFRKQEFSIFIKLFITTGCSWILLLVNFFIENLTIYLLISVCNTLQGLCIFLAYICNKRIYLMYKSKLGSCRQNHLTYSERSTTLSSLSPSTTQNSSYNCFDGIETEIET